MSDGRDLESARRRLDMLEDIVTSPHDDAEARLAAQSMIEAIRDDLRAADTEGK